jgi:hypothetical protein
MPDSETAVVFRILGVLGKANNAPAHSNQATHCFGNEHRHMHASGLVVEAAQSLVFSCLRHILGARGDLFICRGCLVDRVGTSCFIRRRDLPILEEV